MKEVYRLAEVDFFSRTVVIRSRDGGIGSWWKMDFDSVRPSGFEDKIWRRERDQNVFAEHRAIFRVLEDPDGFVVEMPAPIFRKAVRGGGKLKIEAGGRSGIWINRHILLGVGLRGDVTFVQNLFERGCTIGPDFKAEQFAVQFDPIVERADFQGTRFSHQILVD